MTQAPLNFDGPTFSAALDGERLTTQFHRVEHALSDGRWWTLRDLQQAVGGSEAGISARLRDLRKQRFGGRTVERRRVSGGLWEYRLVRGNG